MRMFNVFIFLPFDRKKENNEMLGKLLECTFRNEQKQKCELAVGKLRNFNETLFIDTLCGAHVYFKNFYNESKAKG